MNMISKIYKYITGGYDKRAIPRISLAKKSINPVEESINPVEYFVKTKYIKGLRNTNGGCVIDFGARDYHYGKFKIGDFEFESDIFSKYEIEYLNQFRHTEIPSGLSIKSAVNLTDLMFTYGVKITASNGLSIFVQGRHTELYKRVWHCLEYQAYLQFPEIFTDKN